MRPSSGKLQRLISLRFYNSGVYSAFLISLFFISCGGAGGSSGSSSPSAGASLDQPHDVGGIGDAPEEFNDPMGDFNGSIAYGAEINAQDGPSGFHFTPSTANNTINWGQFGVFHLNGRTLVYNGPHFNNDSNPALLHGFTHTCSMTTAGRQNTTPSQRAILWTGPTGPVGTPWRELRSPWGNSMSTLQAYWTSYMASYANMFNDTAGQSVPNIDLLISDMESAFWDDAGILSLKGNAIVPPEINQLSDADFIDRYKRDMAALHNAAHAYVKAKGFAGRLGSYGETFITRTWWGIPQHTWNSWITDYSLLNYLLMDYQGGSNWLQNPGPFYQSFDVNTPSAYLFYEYPSTKESNSLVWNGAGNYLAYTLFQIESNMAWSNKNYIPYIWLQYHNSTPYINKFIRPHMAHALGIFPFLTPIEGLWVWDYYPDSAGDPNRNFSAYEYFLYGVYRLSQYNSIFTGNYEYYAPKNSRDLMVDQSPVVRGVHNKDQKKLLVAVHNPYAKPDETTVVPIQLGYYSLGNVEVKGLNVALVVLDSEPAATCVGDFNRDGVVDAGDLGILISDLGKSGPNLPTDLNNDTQVNQSDVAIFNQIPWAACP